MRVLGLDCGSKVTGYAVLDGLEARDLVDCGRITYDAEWLREHTTELLGASRPALAEHMATRDVAGWVRCHVIAAALVDILEEHRPAAIALEVADGKCGTGSKRGASGSLATWGMAVGWLSGVASMWGVRAGSTPPIIVPVGVRQWTRGGGNKARRVLAIGAAYPHERWSQIDPGGDVRDAIGVARFAQHLLGEASERVEGSE
jgi:hypothetical protein